jgi:hypothetical protein
MTKSLIEMTFECEEHQLFYEALQKQIEDGVCPEMQAAAIQIGLHPHYLHKNKKEPWERQMTDAFKNATSEWRRNGGHPTAKKFKDELQAMMDAEEEPIGTVLCRRVGVCDRYLANPMSPWADKIKNDFNKAREHWEKYGGKDYKELKTVLKAMTKAGERAFSSQVAIRGGKHQSYFSSQYLFPWQKKLLKEIEKANLKWQESGGSDYKKLKKTLTKAINLGERPSISSVCEEAVYNAQNLITPKFFWQAKIKAELKEAGQDWEQHGGSSYKKCKTALDAIVKAGEIPTLSSVAIKAGFSSRLLTCSNFPWKQKILNKIEEAVGNELKILFVDLGALIHNVAEKEVSLGDYRRLGVSVKNPKVELPNRYNLAHIMYGTFNMVRSSNHNISKVFVDQTSYNENRRVYIDGIIRACEGMTTRYSNIETYIPRMTEAAIWLGNKIPSSMDEAKQAFRDYSEYLRKMLKSTELKHSSAHQRQYGMLKLLAGMLCVDESKISEDSISLLTPQQAPKSNAFSNVAKFTQEELAYAFAFYYHLFDQIADFLLENKPYPHVIQLPRGNATILGVSHTMIVPAYKPPRSGSMAISYDDGHILSNEEIEEVLALAPKNKRQEVKSSYQKSKQNALKQLNDVNSKSNHPKRLKLGKKALDAWFMCMLYLTTANDSTLAGYEWSKKDEYETEHNERKEFITIKPRAVSKTIRFTFPKAFMPSFQKAIKLRSFVLDRHDFPYLFFGGGYGAKARMTKVQSRGGMSGSIVSQMIDSLDSELPRVCSTASRKDGARDALATHGIEVALSVLQNEKDTLVGNYNGQTAEELASQVSGLMQDLHDVISGKPIDENQQSSMGGCGCEGELKPETFSDESPVKADCLDQKSCIFCVHYVTFPESEEIRKLLSLKYLIENVAYDRTEDEAFYEKEMKPWLIRIEVILDAMVEKEPKAEAMIERVWKEVHEEGLLSPYWLEWVGLLDELGRFE